MAIIIVMTPPPFLPTMMTMTKDNDYTIYCVLHDARTHNGKIPCIYTTHYHIETLNLSRCGFLMLTGFEYMRIFPTYICLIVTGIRNSDREIILCIKVYPNA